MPPQPDARQKSPLFMSVCEYLCLLILVDCTVIHIFIQFILLYGEFSFYLVTFWEICLDKSTQKMAFSEVWRLSWVTWTPFFTLCTHISVCFHWIGMEAEIQEIEIFRPEQIIICKMLLYLKFWLYCPFNTVWHGCLDVLPISQIINSVLEAIKAKGFNLWCISNSFSPLFLSLIDFSPSSKLTSMETRLL